MCQLCAPRYRLCAPCMPPWCFMSTCLPGIPIPFVLGRREKCQHAASCRIGGDAGLLLAHERPGVGLCAFLARSCKHTIQVEVVRAAYRGAFPVEEMAAESR